jgi:hypothetical protein
VRAAIWTLYGDLKNYRQHPSPARKTALAAEFDRIFTRTTGFVTLDRLLGRLHANKTELLMVLERPEIPLHTNATENDIRCQVTRRKVSGGTRSDVGRHCRDAFLGLVKTCAKLGIAFWDYLGARLHIPERYSDIFIFFEAMLPEKAMRKACHAESIWEATCSMDCREDRRRLCVRSADGQALAYVLQPGQPKAIRFKPRF